MVETYEEKLNLEDHRQKHRIELIHEQTKALRADHDLKMLRLAESLKIALAGGVERIKE